MLNKGRAGGATWIEASQGVYCVETKLFESGFVRSTLVVGERGAALIDCGTVDTYPQVLGLIDQIGLTAADLRYLILTHSHADHVGSMTALRQTCDSVVLAHRESVPFCKDFRLQFDSLFGAFPEEIPPTSELRMAISSLVLSLIHI